MAVEGRGSRVLLQGPALRHRCSAPSNDHELFGKLSRSHASESSNAVEGPIRNPREPETRRDFYGFVPSWFPFSCLGGVPQSSCAATTHPRIDQSPAFGPIRLLKRVQFRSG